MVYIYWLLMRAWLVNTISPKWSWDYILFLRIFRESSKEKNWRGAFLALATPLFYTFRRPCNFSTSVLVVSVLMHARWWAWLIVNRFKLHGLLTCIDFNINVGRVNLSYITTLSKFQTQKSIFMYVIQRH